MISKWKLQAQQNMAQLFDQKASIKDIASADDIKNLHAKIGQLTIELDFLEHASNQFGFGGFKKGIVNLTSIEHKKRLRGRF